MIQIVKMKNRIKYKYMIIKLIKEILLYQKIKFNQFKAPTLIQFNNLNNQKKYHKVYINKNMNMKQMNILVQKKAKKNKNLLILFLK